MSTSIPRIAVVGAGPGGLMLASILHKHGISCTIFERDSSAAARDQGGSLDIHDDTGQKALDAAGLLDEFRSLVRVDGEATRIIKKDGTVLFEDDGARENTLPEDGGNQQEEPETKYIEGRPEIDRPALKNLLISSLPADTIRWASKVTSVTPIQGSRQWEVKLDGESEPLHFDLVVGADGARSCIRSLLTNQEPIFSGITALDVWKHHGDETAPDVSAFVGPGSVFMFDKDRALFFQRGGQGPEANVRCYACVKTFSKFPPTAKELLGLENGGSEDLEVNWEEARTREGFIERNFGDWSPEVKHVVQAINENPVLRPLYMLPVGLKWESRPGITLLGDAAHLMTPFAGAGVNTALMDALELAQGIMHCLEAENTDDEGLAAMIQRYETGMFVRSGQVAAKTNAAMHTIFGEDGAEKMIAMMGPGPDT
ncbi:hypothetical protein GGS20DRAFT_529669 [Poronia punctata]|nr:hypothetical protein GGS20DRAFT_529669 [Poronia punctata]